MLLDLEQWWSANKKWNWSSSAEVVKGESKGKESKESRAIGAIQVKYFKRVLSKSSRKVVHVKCLSKADNLEVGNLKWLKWGSSTGLVQET